jgi:predicted transcriptional regulator
MIMSAYRSDALGHGPRGYMEIVYSILSVCLNGALKTHVMFRCNLNSKQLHFYIESLLVKGLLDKERAPPSAKVEYRTTQRGRKYLETYSALLQMLNEERRVMDATFAQSTGME